MSNFTHFLLLLIFFLQGILHFLGCYINSFSLPQHSLFMLWWWSVVTVLVGFFSFVHYIVHLIVLNFIVYWFLLLLAEW